MDESPKIVVVSCSNTKPLSLIKLITKEKNIELDPTTGIVVYPWKLDTKYYECTASLCGIDEMYKRTKEFNDGVQAMLIHMDSNKESGLADLNLWNEAVKECDPEIKLLITNYCTNDTKITKSEALHWCLKHNFELIELYPTVTEPKSEEDIIEEKFGVDRIVEALHTHVWPNMQLKQNGENKLKSGNFPDDGLDDFSDLFAELNMMKGSLQSMPASQRIQLAEEMVTAFWNAMGGSEDELLDV